MASVLATLLSVVVLVSAVCLHVVLTLDGTSDDDEWNLPLEFSCNVKKNRENLKKFVKLKIVFFLPVWGNS